MAEITINAQDGSGSFFGYLATPASGSGPGIVVIQEIFGVNQVMRDITDWLAGEGYVALCPDLFWRIEPRIELTDKSQAEWDRAFELYQAFDVPKGVDDIQAAVTALRAQPACSGKVGAVGYCLGGLLAYLTGCKTDADTAVGYYGVGIDGMLDAAQGLAKPLVLHIAEEDGFCPKEAQAQILQGLGGNDAITIYSYAGQDHAFARVGGEHYNAEAAGLANQRTLEAFRAALGS